MTVTDDPVAPQTGGGWREPRARLRGRLFAWLLMLALVTGLTAGAFISLRLGKEGQRNAVTISYCSPGPWGDLEYVPLMLERPDEFISIQRWSTQQARWFFENFSREEVLAFLAQSGLTPAQMALLQRSAQWQSETNGVYLSPGSELVLSLEPRTRQQIYSFLAESAANPNHQTPFSFRKSGFDEWFSQSGLSPETIEMIRRLTYARGEAICFSDVTEALLQIEAADEQKRLIKTLSRHSSLLLRLRIDAQSDIPALVQYWGKAGRSKDLRPLLESLARVPGGTRLDVTHLLHPFARQRLYSYPFPPDDSSTYRGNCFWTALNFFNDVPDDRFYNLEFVLETLARDYYPIEEDPAYGDIIGLTKPGLGLFHTAVYVADDIVFTKNGMHYSQPWILMKLDDMIARYPSDKSIRATAYRLKRG